LLSLLFAASVVSPRLTFHKQQAYLGQTVQGEHHPKKDRGKVGESGGGAASKRKRALTGEKHNGNKDKKRAPGNNLEGN